MCARLTFNAKSDIVTEDGQGMVHMGTKKYEIDFTEGKMLKNIIAFALPIILSGWLQTLFSIADMMVLGLFVGDGALAAVGSTSSLINLLVNMFVGLAGGVTVVVSQGFGARDNDKMSKAAHTAIAISIFAGILLAVVGVLVARPLLQAMDSPADVIGMSTLYVQVYFAGIPLILLYNFTSSIMRAYGDNKRPLYFVALSGVLNVVLNVVTVVVFRWSVAGVAIATFVSQGVAALLNLHCLIHADNACKIDLKKVRFNIKEFLEILRFGIPMGIQSIMFSLSNVFLQSAINSFGSQTMAAHGAVNYMGNVLGQISNGFGNAATTVCAQNYGAKKKDRVFAGWKTCIVGVGLVLLVLGAIAVLIMPIFMRIFTKELSTVEIGCKIASYYLPFWFIGGVMTTSSYSLRGIGYSTVPMLVSIFGTCVMRVIWIYTVFASFRSLHVLYTCYPVTWLITALVQNILFLYFWRKLDFLKE